MEKAAFKDLTILERLSEIENELPRVQKNIELKAGSSSYKAVSEVDVKNAVKPLEYKWGVKSTPVETEIVEARELEREGYNGKKRVDLFVRMRITTRFACVDKPSEYIDVTTYGDGIDPQDKAVGKASTYGLKYGLMNAYKLETGDDPDLQASVPQTKVEVPDNKRQAAKLYAHAKTLFETEEQAQTRLQSYLLEKHKIKSLRAVNFDEMNLVEMMEDFETWVATNKAKEEQLAGVQL